MLGPPRPLLYLYNGPYNCMTQVAARPWRLRCLVVCVTAGLQHLLSGYNTARRQPRAPCANSQNFKRRNEGGNFFYGASRQNNLESPPRD